MWNNNFRPLFIFTCIHFYFDRVKLFMIESESLLDWKFCPAGELFKNLVGSKKKIVFEKKVIDNLNRLEYVVCLVAPQVLVATLVFENRIAEIKVICE